MALKFTDKLKSIDLLKAADVISKIKTSENDIQKHIKFAPKQEEEIAIDSVDALSCYLNSLKPEASPSVMMALQSQLHILKYVQSPSMTLMVIDNIMVCLYKGIKSAGNDAEKELLREAFISLLQSFIFVAEARLQYEIETDKKEAMQLLANAGDMLISSVSSTAMLIVPIAAGVKMGHALPKMVNVLATSGEQQSFLGRLIAVKGKKALIEEKKQEFYKTLEYIFETLDNYAKLIGPSIQLHGMLKRYADGMIENYSIKQYANIKKLVNENETIKLESFVSTASQKDVTNNFISGMAMIGKAVVQMTKQPKTLDYNSACNIKRALQSDLKGYETQLEKIDANIAQIKKELSGTSFIQFGRKSELNSKLSDCMDEKNGIEEIAQKIQQRINVVEDIIGPINRMVEEYRAKLNNVVTKFECNIN